MSLTVAELSFIFNADTREVDRALGTVGRDIDRAASRGTRVMGNFWRAAGVGATAFAGGAAVFLKGAISEASNLGESVNAVNVTFGKAARGIRRLAKSAADDVGLSKTQFQGLAVQFSNFATTVAGGKGRAVVKTMDDLTTRAADFASVMNLDVNEAATLFQSGLAGETEPLRRFGIDLSAAAVEAHALSEGIVKNKADLDEAAKVQARYSLLMQSTEKTSGDFKNTQDSLANVMRRLGAHFDNSQAKLGKGFLPALESAGKYLIDEGIPALNRFSDWFNKEGIPAIQDFAGWVMDDAVPAVKDFAGFLGDAMGHAKDLVGWLRDLPDPAKYAGLAALLGGGVVAKVRGGGGGLAGKALGAVVGVKGTPVYVTNWAQIAGGGGGGVGGGKPGVGGPAALVLGGAAVSKALGVVPGMPYLPDMSSDDSKLRFVKSVGRLGEAFGLVKAGARDAGDAISDTERDWDRFRAAVADGTTEGERRFRNLFDTMKDVDRLDPDVTVKAPGLAGLLGYADGLSDRLDRLDGRTVTTYFNAVNSKAAAGGIPLDQLVGRHAGGPTNAGQWYIVGEKGPELFQAGVQGRVYSNRDSAAMLGSATAAQSGAAPVIDYDRLTRALLQARPIHGDVHISGDPTVYRREMDRDAHAAAYSGMPT